MKTLKKIGGIDSRNPEPAAEDPIWNERLPAGTALNKTNPPNDVDAMVSSFLLELNSISHPWGSASDTETSGKASPDEVASGDQGVGSSERIFPPDDDFTALESKVAVADLDRRIASILDELEREQGKVAPLPLKEIVKLEPARPPAAKSQAAVTQGIQKPPAADTKPEPSAGLPQKVTPKHEAVRPAAKLKARPAGQSAIHVQSSLRRIPAAGWVLAPAGLLGAAAAIWIFMGSPWFGKEKLPSVAPAVSAATAPQALASEPPQAALASVSETTAAKTIPSQPVGSESQRGVAETAELQARTKARSGNSAQTTTTKEPSRPDPRVAAQTRTTAGGITAQPSEPEINISAARPLPEQPREAVTVETAPSAAAIPVSNIRVPASPPSPPPMETAVIDAPAVQAPVLSPNADPERSMSAAPAIPSAGGTAIVRERQITLYPAPKPPVALSKITPEYPPLAKRLGISGTVVVSVDVNEEGNVDRAVATSGPSQLRAAAENALRQWKFTPATQNGIKAKSSLSISVVFNK